MMTSTFLVHHIKKMTAMKFKLSMKINVTILVILNWKKVL